MEASNNMESLLYNDVITVYNRYTIGLPPFSSREVFDRAVIKGVHYETDVDKNPDSQGKATISQTVLILIPKGADQGGKIYLPPNEYNRISVDNNKYWTLDTRDENKTFIIRGVGREISAMYSIEQLQKDGGVLVKGVSDMLDSKVLPHLEIRCI